MLEANLACTLHLVQLVQWSDELAVLHLKVVSLHVRMEVRLLVEALVAPRVGALEWFLASVDPLMCLQVEIKRESLATDVTLVRFLPLTEPAAVIRQFYKRVLYLQYERACVS